MRPTSMMPVIAVLLLVPRVGAQTSGVPGAIVVGPNVQVSADRPSAVHDEVLIAADPADASHLLACSMFLPERGVWKLMGATVYTSFDGGRDWSLSLSDSADLDAPEGRFDPSCAYGPDGSAYFSLLPLTVYRSTDAGRTWIRSAVTAPHDQDRDYVVADNTGGGYRGRVYLHAQMPGQYLDGGVTRSAITLWRSLDGGRTFGLPVQSFPDAGRDGRSTFHLGNGAVTSDGTWIAVFNELSLAGRNDGLAGSVRAPPSRVNSHIDVISSRDGGASLERAVVVSDAYSDWRQVNTLPTIAVDAGVGPFRDRLYVVWTDARFGARDQMLLSYSSDGGRTWASPRLVNDDLRYHDNGGPERNVGLVTVAVNGDGVVGVAWEDRRDNSTDEVGYEIRFAASLDGGDTFTPSVRVSEKPHAVGKRERWIAQASATGATVVSVYRNEWSTGGHTMGLAADANGIFHPLWVDNRTGVHQVWTATVKVRGTPVRFGAPELASLRDLGDGIRIEPIGVSFDREARRFELSIRLRNGSRQTVYGPLVLRALILLSEASTDGAARAMNADNDKAGPGALWHFRPSLEGDSLAPGDVSPSRVLTFQLPGLRTIGAGITFDALWPWPRRLLRFEGQVLGRRAASSDEGRAGRNRDDSHIGESHVPTSP